MSVNPSSGSSSVPNVTLALRIRCAGSGVRSSSFRISRTRRLGTMIWGIFAIGSPPRVPYRGSHILPHPMPGPNRFDVDGTMASLTLEEAAARCGLPLQVKGSGAEVRIDCPFGCSGDHAGRCEISVNTDHPARVWKCHSYGCELRGNLFNLMHGWLTGTRWSGERLHGEQFKRVREVLAGGAPPARSPTPPRADAPPPARGPAPEPKRNVPLLQSDDERMRALMEPPLDEKLVQDPAAMPPAASAYVRRHGCLTSEAMQKWRVGVMPKDAGADKRGFSLRGHLVYPFLSEQGEVLAFVGRDVAYEEKERAFTALPEEQRRSATPPAKHRFPKHFHRGIELYGQHAERLNEPGYREAIARYGLILVEGFNDVIGLDNHGLPALGICSNRITAEQVEKVAKWARLLSAGMVSLLFDCEPHGDEGAKDAAWLLLQQGLDVHLGWSQSLHGGAFRGRQPESLTPAELSDCILPWLERSRGVRSVTR